MRKRGFEVCTGYEDKDINMPIRKTKNSVGYDFEAAEITVIPTVWKTIFSNIGKFLKGNKDEIELFKPTLVKTGLKSYFGEEEVLVLANRSSNPAKKGLILANGIGIIDADYYENKDNDGHIMFAFYNIFPFDVVIKKHDIIGQGYFQNFLIADNDNTTGDVRTGGFGSTDEK